MTTCRRGANICMRCRSTRRRGKRSVFARSPSGETSPTHSFIVQAGREHQDIVSVLPCSPRKDNADLEKYNRFTESPEYERFLQKVDRSAPRRLARPHSDKENTPTALPSGQGSNQKGNRASWHRREKAATRHHPVQNDSFLVQSPRDNQYQRAVASKRAAKIPRADVSSGKGRRLDKGLYRPPGSRVSSTSSDLQVATKESSKIKDEEPSEGWVRSDRGFEILGKGAKG